MNIKEFCQNYIGHKLDFKTVVDEFFELLSADSLENLFEEANDVLFVFQVWLHQRIKVNWLMVWSGPAIAKMSHRVKMWEDIFDDNNLVFDLKYLKNGSNYLRPHKVQLALDLAKKEQK